MQCTTDDLKLTLTRAKLLHTPKQEASVCKTNRKRREILAKGRELKLCGYSRAKSVWHFMKDFKREKRWDHQNMKAAI